MTVNRRIVWNHDQTSQMESVRWKIWQVKANFIKQHRLATTSHPVEWMNAFLPLCNNKNGWEEMSVYKWATFTNLKETLAIGGSPWCFPTFTAFTPVEVLCFIGLYMLHRLPPTPQLERKFLLQAKDPVCDNGYFVSGMIWQNERKRLSEIKAFFAVQDPSIMPLEKNKFQLWSRPHMKGKFLASV